MNVSRREALALLAGAGAAAAQTGAQFAYSSIDHIEFFVRDLPRSRDFYTAVFGEALKKNRTTERRYLKLGTAYLAFEPRPASIQVDHFCVGVPRFDIAAMHTRLEMQGIAYRDYPSGRDLAVTDPDGIRMQLAADNGWDALPADLEQTPAREPVFRPLQIEHMLLHVSDPAASEAFYTKVLGPAAQKRNNRTWFHTRDSRIGLLATPTGGKAGVDHYCVQVREFDEAAVARQLEALGTKLEQSEVPGSPQFRDPDGYLIQVAPPPRAQA